MAGKQRPLKLRQASAFYRCAAKAMYAGQFEQAARYTRRADRLVEENRRDRERLKGFGRG